MAKDGGGGAGFRPPQDDWALFETCQRRIFITMAPAVLIDTEVAGRIHRGEAAYALMLRILCGLESRIVGETEIFGQFKSFVRGMDGLTLSWAHRFQSLAQNLIVDAKEVRNSGLGAAGRRSYGALAHAHVKSCRELAIVGGGQLARKVLPYLAGGGHHIRLYLRTPSKAAGLLGRTGNDIEVLGLGDRQGPRAMDGLIVAAPMASHQIEGWLEQTGCAPAVIVDLRDQSADRRLDAGGRLITLDDLFAEIERTSTLLETQIGAAGTHITSLARERFAARHFRPHGWEDICA